MPGTHKQSLGSRTIRIGSSFGADREITDSEIHTFTLRVQKDVIEQVDEIVSKHPVIRNRNTWIVNAIVEQLKRERLDHEAQ